MAEENVKLVGASCTEGKEVNILVSVKDFINGEWTEVSIPREDFTPRAINKAIVSNNGVCQNAKAVCKGILKMFEVMLISGTLMVKKFHERLGWNWVKDKLVFYGENTVSLSNEVDSTYSGKVDIAGKGSIDAFSNMITSQITTLPEWSPLEAVISFGVGATVLAYANTAWVSSLNNVIVHLAGASSTGKSTALMLFVGLGSNPNPKKGFWINYSSSEASIIKRIGDNNGYPVAIDELSSGSKKEYSSMVYAVGNGEEKDRLMPGGREFQESATFQTVALSSGEMSLIKKCSKDGGIRARCIELSNIAWTDSKQQAVAIKECMKENHGLVTSAIAKELLDNDSIWRERWEYWRGKMANKLEAEEVKLSVSERISDYVALFALSAEIANAVLNVELNVHEIFKFCYEYIIIANEEEGNMAVRAYSTIIEYISLHKERFADATFYSGCRSQYDDITLEVFEDGFFHNVNEHTIPEKGGGRKCTMVYVFRPGVIENVLSDAGFSDGKVALYQLRQGKYLKTKDNKRNTYPYTINGSKQNNCVAVYYRDETMDGCEIDE